VVKIDDKRKFILFGFLLLLLPEVSAMRLDESSQIYPDEASATGYYDLNESVFLDELDVNATHAKFSGLDSLNQSCWDVDTGEELCGESSICELPATNTLKRIVFTSPPDITITSPTNITYSTIPINLNVSVNEHADLCQYNLNGTANLTMDNTSQTNWFIATGLNPALDTHHLRVYCNDTFGKENTNDVWFTYSILDVTAPVITISSPLNSTYANLPILLNVSVNENVTECQYNLNGTANATLSNTSQTDWFLAYGISPAEATHHLRVYCNDTSNNDALANRWFTYGKNVIYIRLYETETYIIVLEIVGGNVGDVKYRTIIK